MIRINLLPVEKRKAERTPLPRLGLLMVTAAAATLLVVYIASIFIRIRVAENNIRDTNEAIKALKPKLDLHASLVQKKNELTTKITEIKDLTQRHMACQWWKAINALWDVINNHPRVWVDDIRGLDERAVQGLVKQADPDDTTAPPAGVTMRCHVSGDAVAEMTKFRMALKNHPVLREFLTNVNKNVDWKIEEEKEYNGSSISFTISTWGPQEPLRAKAPEPPPKPPAPPTGAPVSAPKDGVK